MSQNMRRQIVLIAFTSTCFVLLTAAAFESRQSDPPSPNDLSLEVAALHGLHRFQVTSEQLSALRKLAVETVPKFDNREESTASEEYLKVLTELRDALVKADDDERIDELSSKLDELDELEGPDLDDGVEITTEARRRLPEVIRMFSSRQVAAFVASFGDEFPDPIETIMNAIAELPKIDPEDLDESIAEFSDEVSWQVAGLDPEPAKKVSEQVTAFLKRVSKLSENDLEKQRTDLESEARKIIGDVSPIDVVKHVVEHDLAELLSNPRLPAALDARLKQQVN